MTFLDSTGLRVFLTAARNTIETQGPIVLVRPSEAVRRLLDLALPGGAPTLVVSDD